MAVLASLKKLFSKVSSAYVVVWREHSEEQTLMRAEPIPAKSDSEAVAMVRSRFQNAVSDWVFWVLFRPGNEIVSAEPGPQISHWHHNFNRVGTDNHVQSTLQAFRADGNPINRPLRRVMLKSRRRLLGMEETE